MVLLLLWVLVALVSEMVLVLDRMRRPLARSLRRLCLLSSGRCVSFGFAFSLGSGRDRGVGLLTPRTSGLCCGTLFSLRSRLPRTNGRFSSYSFSRKCKSAISRNLDGALPGQQATICALSADVADIFIFGKNVAAKHETPNLLPCLAKFNGESFHTSRLGHVNQLGQAIFILGIGGDASRDLGSGAGRIWKICIGEHVIKDAVTQGPCLPHEHDHKT